MAKKGPCEASDTVEISSEEDNTPHNKKKTKATHDGQEESGSPTKPGESPPAATTESEAPENARHPSQTPTGQKGGSPTKPGENPTAASTQPVQEVDVEHQHTTPTAYEEKSTTEQEVQEDKDEDERYQKERKMKGKEPATKKKNQEIPGRSRRPL